jgi:hypothetical protein
VPAPDSAHSSSAHSNSAHCNSADTSSPHKNNAHENSAHTRPEDSVLTDSSRIARWAGPLFTLCTLALIPWIIYLSGSLPARQVSHHYNAAWVGIDVLEVIALGATALCAFRRSPYLAMAASSAGTLLIVDAWFDVMTSPRHERLASIMMAVLIELPLAAVCWWLSHHSEHLTEQRLHELVARLLRRG